MAGFRNADFIFQILGEKNLPQYFRYMMQVNRTKKAVKSTLYRLRPYVYNPDVPTEEKLTKGSTLSFFSGHSTMAFSSAIFLSTMFQKYFPNSKFTPYIWGTSLVCASIVGYLRIYSGQHFPSDVITGAIVGSLVGYLIPLIHENRKDKLETLPFKIHKNNIFSIKINF